MYGVSQYVGNYNNNGQFIITNVEGRTNVWGVGAWQNAMALNVCCKGNVRTGQGAGMCPTGVCGMGCRRHAGKVGGGASALGRHQVNSRNRSVELQVSQRQVHTTGFGTCHSVGVARGAGQWPPPR